MRCRFSVVDLIVSSLFLTGIFAWEALDHITSFNQQDPDIVVVVDLAPRRKHFIADEKFKQTRVDLTKRIVWALDYVNNVGISGRVAVCFATADALDQSGSQFVVTPDPSKPIDQAEGLKSRWVAKDNSARTRDDASLKMRQEEVFRYANSWPGSKKVGPVVIIWVSSAEVSDNTEGYTATMDVFRHIGPGVDEVFLLARIGNESMKTYMYNGYNLYTIDTDVNNPNENDKFLNLTRETLNTSLSKCIGKQGVDETECKLEAEQTCRKSRRYSPSSQVSEQDRRLCWYGAEDEVDCGNKCDEYLCFNLDRKASDCDASCGESGKQVLTVVETEEWHKYCLNKHSVIDCYGARCTPGDEPPVSTVAPKGGFEIEAWKIAVAVIGGVAVLGILAIIVVILVVNCRDDSRDAPRKHIHPPGYSRFRDRRGDGRSPDVRDNRSGGRSDQRTDQRYNRQSPSRGRR